MPRDGANIYHRPPGTDAVPDTTIESSKYNAYVADIEQDLNLPRPIVAGGTGANNAHDAMVALSGEIAKQQVTNYDSFAFVNGSFWSNAGSTSEPVAGHHFYGIYYEHGNPAYATVEARDLSDGVGKLYVRQKAGGVWGAWVLQGGSVADLDAAYVNVTGDTMTGPLGVANAFTLSGPGQPAFSFVSTGAAVGKQRMSFLYDGGTALVAPGVVIQNQADAGGFVSNSAVLWRDGSLSLGDITKPPAAGSIQVGTTTGTYYFGNSGTKSLTYDGTASFQFNGATNLMHSGTSLWLNYVSSTGGAVIEFNGSGTKYLQYDGTNFSLTGGNVYLNSPTLTVGQGGAIGQVNFGNAGTKYLYYDGTNFNLNGGPLFTEIIQANNRIIAAASPTTGIFVFGSNQSSYLQMDGAHFNLVGAPLNCTSGGTAAFGGGIGATGHQCRSGISGVYSSNFFNLYYTGPTALWIDATNLGNISVTSDYRIKKDVLDLPSMWDAVKGLRPIKYTQADFTPPAQLDANKTRRSKYAADVEEAKAKGVEPPPAPEIPPEPMFKADNIERWGFIAHELQDTLVPSASTGHKDSPDHVQSPDPFTVIAALTKALQEAMTRIEALEAR